MAKAMKIGYVAPPLYWRFLVALLRWFVIVGAMALSTGAPGALAKSANSRNAPPAASQNGKPTGDDMAIPLPKDLIDNSNPFDAGPSSSTDGGSRYFRQQQNFREQDPVRDQEGDRIIRQFEYSRRRSH